MRRSNIFINLFGTVVVLELAILGIWALHDKDIVNGPILMGIAIAILLLAFAAITKIWEVNKK